MNVMEARRRTIGGGIYEKTSSGEMILANGSLARRYPGIRLYGQSTQASTTGAQLFDISKVISRPGRLENNGNSLHVTTIAGDEAAYGLPPNTLRDYAPNLEAGQTYYLTANSTGETKSIYLGGTVWNFNSSCVVTENMLQSAVYFYASGEETEADISDIMICEGSTAKPFEPYTGGAPSPSPEYPQEIVSKAEDGNVEVEVLGGNLWDEQNDSPYANGRRYVFYCKPNTNYVIHTGKTVSSIEVLLNNFVDTNNPYAVSYNRDTLTFNSGENEILYLQTYSPGDNSYTVMLNIGSTALPYESYNPPQTLTASTPNGLPGIPVTSGGNYTDEDGQQWVCDEVDFKRGVYVQRIGSYEFTGNESVYDDYFPVLIAVLPSPSIYGNPAAYSSWAMMSNYAKNTYLRFSNNTGRDIAFNDSSDFWGVENSSKLKELLKNKYDAGNPVKIIYPLATPIETPLTPTELSAYSALHTNYPTTTVMDDEGVYMSLDYKTKKSLEVK